ncbi:MAG: CRISPR system precrRNA processing endoribonuclease RAMP protein Cas6 [Candidatus Lokiarchaeota archaeon]|nr:CRISPR system precrRNA processing endoribonuclease RAMP protein Cas6 [Candidatus Lokiarchaeota archaeon]
MYQLEFTVSSLHSREIRFSGGALRAAFLGLVSDIAPALGKDMHDGNDIRTYAIDPFRFNSDFHTSLDVDEDYKFGVNLLHKTRYKPLVREMIGLENSEIEVFGKRMPVLQIDFKMHHPLQMMHNWTGDNRIKNAPKALITMRFRTPTQLAHLGSEALYLYPDPEKIFPSLLKIWAEVGGKAIPVSTGEYRDWVRTQVYTSRHRIQTYPVKISSTILAIGFIGRVDYTIDNPADPLARLTIGLAQLAELSNIGKHRTAGLGKVNTTVKIDDGNGNMIRCKPN